MSWAERWTERAWERITRRIVRRIAVLESDGAKMSTGALILHNLASYRDLLYMVCLRPLLRRERGEE